MFIAGISATLETKHLEVTLRKLGLMWGDGRFELKIKIQNVNIYMKTRSNKKSTPVRIVTNIKRSL